MTPDLERQHDVVTEGATDLVGGHLEQRPVGRAACRDHDMVDPVGQAHEEPLQSGGVVGVEGGGAPRPDVERRPLQPLGIPAGEDDLGSLAAGASGGLQPDARAAADDDDRLAEQLRLMEPGGRGGCRIHGAISCHWRYSMIDHLRAVEREEIESTSSRVVTSAVA